MHAYIFIFQCKCFIQRCKYRTPWWRCIIHQYHFHQESAYYSWNCNWIIIVIIHYIGVKRKELDLPILILTGPFGWFPDRRNTFEMRLSFAIWFGPLFNGINCNVDYPNDQLLSYSFRSAWPYLCLSSPDLILADILFQVPFLYKILNFIFQLLTLFWSQR